MEAFEFLKKNVLYDYRSIGFEITRKNGFKSL